MDEKKVFDFELEQRVRLRMSGELGMIVSRAESIYSKPNYQVRYVSASGEQLESWWDATALEVDHANDI